MKDSYFIPMMLLMLPVWAFSQTGGGSGFSLVIVNERRQPVSGATVRQLQKGTVVNSQVAGEDGRAVFAPFNKGTYRFLISSAGYQPKTTDEYRWPGPGSDTVRLVLLNTSLQEMTVTAHLPPVERKRDKTVVNVEASVTNTGATLLEVLERSPGVTVDRNGGISLNGKQGVLVMIDDKPTYLSGEDLNNLLSSMSASQVARIELMPNPTARYDAAGSAGVINIKTKKSNSDGLNGSFTTSYGQGVYPKNNNNLVLNYRKGPLNIFFNYSFSVTKYLTDLYAYRRYFADDKSVVAILQQSAYFTGTVDNHTVKTGVEYRLSQGTTVGMALTGVHIHRKGNNAAHADWLQTDGKVDSSVLTQSRPVNFFRNGAINLNARQRLSENADLSVDLDYLHYAVERKQDFDNQLLAPGGYHEVFRSNVPTTINIFSGKLDATVRVHPGVTLQAGLKSSSNHTDNASAYENLENQQWVKDDTRSNHFVYQENIHAAYGTIEGKYHRLSYQAGSRYEYTSYQAHQLGNRLQKDSTVSRNYGSLFPSGYLSYKLDTLNSLTLTVARRIDRPPFQSLNPFLYIINKYTYETGNPYLLPQYSWNYELTHQYGSLLTTGVSYSRLSNYFSQIFLSDTTKTILYYTQGNVGRAYNLGLSASVSLSPLRWWSVELSAVYNHKQLRGFSGNNYMSTIDQLHVNVNHQLDFGKGYTGELSGFYTTRSREDIQELLYPAGQVSTGMSKTVLKKKGTLKVSYRDIFYTGAMEGLTSFPDATEYFKMKRDSRVVSVAFTYRFGKSYKISRHLEGASEEKERAPNG
ncbi:TonB-dependent receptor [Flavitalea sp. BT771]|nr:TonB-dependent receptor [Flavitalea sp. BT771]MDO6435669.1 TonB-dependent receptor [Flavitalea sp. BT771]MDV6224570.1 TonB-dependent receptor [Flavitalea sp. BT771]